MSAMRTSVVAGERAEAGGESAAGGATGASTLGLPHGLQVSAEEANEMSEEERGGEEGKETGVREGESDSPGSPSEAADVEGAAGASGVLDGSEAGGWRGRAERAEVRVAELGDRLGAVEAAAEDLRRMVGESERARQVDRELLIAGVVELEAARELVEAQVSEGSTVLEAVSRVRERKPLLFAGRVGGGVRATTLPALDGGPDGSLADVAEVARATGDRRLLLRYLRMRRGEG